MQQLGQILVDRGLVTEAQLSEAQDEQNSSGMSLGRVLVGKGYVEEHDLVAALAHQIGMEFVHLEEASIDGSVVSSIPDSLARRYVALPYAVDDDGRLLVAMSDPANVFALDDIRTITGRELRPIVATRDDILAAIDRFSSMSDDIEEIASDLDFGVDDVADLAALEAVTEDAPIVKFVNLLITQAVQDGASDIHIEPGEKQLRVRYRIDGVLKEVMKSPKAIQAGVVSRLKIMAEVDIAERRIPQDGRIALQVGGKPIDLRFSTLPTVYGEKVVMRILDRSNVMLELSDLGLREGNMRAFSRAYKQPYGMILVTGPTGSGKSTTLYATLNVLNEPQVNIITTEDPVEYRLGGISQVQVNKKAGLTFASALRSILRQDPDIVLVGEMRDAETAQIGVEAALTGHLVLSTLHTNDAPSAVVRLTEMGIEPFLIGSALEAVVAQRLARRVCSRCVTFESLEEAVYREAGFDEEIIEKRPELPRAVGCPACSSTGYKGRLAVHEVLTVTEEIQRLTVERADSDTIKRMAIEQGMEPLRQDGLAKVLAGKTTIEEIARVIV